MPSYATPDNIASEFKDITFSTTTKVTTAEVTAFLTQADQEINATIGVKYKAPIIEGTHPEAFDLLKSIAISIVAARVSDILKVKTPGPAIDQDSKGEKREIWGRKMLSKLAKGTMLLLDSDGNQIPGATTHDGVRSFNVNSDVKNLWKKGVDQW